MTDQEFIRPDVAAARFSVHRDTLAKWARRGLIGRSQVERKGVVLYRVSDIADVIASHETRRTVVPITGSSPTTQTDDDAWRKDPLWAGTEVAR